MEKVLVTGATGFIGGYVIEELLRLGNQVVATSSSLEKAQKKPWFSRVTFIGLNFAQFDESVDYFSLFGKPDRMIHLAWEGLPDYKNDKHLSEYHGRHLRFLSHLVRSGLKDLTVTGTCLEYGMVNGCLREDMECEPSLPYPKAKDLLRKDLTPIAEKSHVHLKWVRLFYMYGKGQHPNSLFSQLNQAISEKKEVFNMSPGDQERDFLPVEKVAEYVVRIALQDRVQGIINCCSGKPVKVLDWVRQYLESRQAAISLNTGFYGYPTYEPMSFWGDNTKLLSIINQ